MTDNNELYLELIFAAIKEVNMQQPPEYQNVASYTFELFGE